MFQFWHHIYPTTEITENIKRDYFIIKFKNGLGVESLHSHNKTLYRCKDVSKDYVDAIYKVNNLHVDNIQIVNILDEKIEVNISKTELQNGQYFFSTNVKIEDMLPYNWTWDKDLFESL
jgi:hypothetical protein